jgi:hypothetical protein
MSVLLLISALGASVNEFGDLSAGNCHVNPNSKIQCPAGGQFPSCEQAFAWPYYYYDKMIWMGDYTQRTDDPAHMIATATKFAEQACENPTSYTGQPTITPSQIASVFLTAFPARTADCPAAVIIAAGECQPASGGAWGSECPPGPDFAGCATVTGCVADELNGIWQNGDATTMTPAESAAALYDTASSHSIPVLCPTTGSPAAPATVPAGYISAGNTNFIGPFCHVNKYVGAAGAFAWGGGQCAGGLGPDPPTASCQCPSSVSAASAGQGPASARGRTRAAVGPN